MCDHMCDADLLSASRLQLGPHCTESGMVRAAERGGGGGADGEAHGVLMWNSNGMDVSISEEQLQYRVIGGVLDLYIFLGPSPAAVMTQLTSIVGRPHFPPYWALGFMNSKCALPPNPPHPFPACPRLPHVPKFCLTSQFWPASLVLKHVNYARLYHSRFLNGPDPRA